MNRFDANCRRGLTLAAVLAGATGPAPSQAFGQQPSESNAAVTARVVRLQRDAYLKGLAQKPKTEGTTGTLTSQAPAVIRFSPNVADTARSIYLFTDQNDETLGATLQPADETLRQQLKLPEGQGLLVVSVAGDGPAARSGLKANDILLTLGDHPIAKADDLIAALKGAGEEQAPLALLRAGKPLTVPVRPVHRVTLGPVSATQTTHYIGISVAPLGDALRAHLNVPKGQGLVATDVVKGSPAEKAGVHAQDVLLSLGDKSLDSPDVLMQRVQAIGAVPTKLKCLRAGVERVVEVTPEPRKVSVDFQIAPSALRVWAVDGLAQPQVHGWAQFPGQPQAHDWANPKRAETLYNVLIDSNKTPPGADGRPDSLDAELKSLRESLDEIKATLKAMRDKPRE